MLLHLLARVAHRRGVIEPDFVAVCDQRIDNVPDGLLVLICVRDEDERRHRLTMLPSPPVSLASHSRSARGLAFRDEIVSPVSSSEGWGGRLVRQLVPIIFRWLGMALAWTAGATAVIAAAIYALALSRSRNSGRPAASRPRSREMSAAMVQQR